MLKYSIPILPHKISGWALTGFTIIVIGYYLDSESVGIYSAIGFLGVIIDVFSKSFFNAYQPWIYKKLKQGNSGHDAIVKVSRLLGFLILCTSSFITFFAKDLIVLLIDSRYHESFMIAPIMIFSSVTLFLGSLFTFILYYYDSATKYVAQATMSGAVINIILSIILTQKFGIIGAVISLALANLVISISKFHYAKKFLKLNISFFDYYILLILILFTGILMIHYDLSLLFRLNIFLLINILLGIKYVNHIKLLKKYFLKQ
jgi:O-antigen/teichoic acid export membrane protein